MPEFIVRNSDDAQQVRAVMHGTAHPYRVIIETWRHRTQAQNRTLHKWFGEVARHYGDRSAADVKAECNLKYGRPIKDRDDPDWRAVFGYLFDALDYEKKLKAIRVLDVPFTRGMNTGQLSEYMDQMQRDCHAEGVVLTIPEDKI